MCFVECQDDSLAAVQATRALQCVVRISHIRSRGAPLFIYPVLVPSVLTSQLQAFLT